VRFRGHLVGGLASGVLTAEIVAQSGQLSSGHGLAWVGVCCTAVVASLLPDLDTSSVPQRWYFRVVFVVLIGMGMTGHFRLATGLAVISLLPLLDHHRGWTHSVGAPLIVPLALGVLQALSMAPAGATGLALVQAGLEGLAANLVYVVAATIGWYTHLLLDGMLNLLPTEPHHH
jgi:membrane-bound metal-dependent hydrolase YbcI (DUF457 family)